MGVTGATGGPPLRVLFVSDTHLGFDQPARPRVERRRRGPDFFECLKHALEPALRGEADVVVHGGDLLYRSRVPASLVHHALTPLVRVADAGVPVLLVPGNHERGALPYPLLAAHERLHVLGRPSTVVVDRHGRRVAFAGFPTRAACGRPSRRLLAATGHRRRRRTRGFSASTSASRAPPAAPARLHVPGRRRRGAGVRPAGRRGRGAVRPRAPAPGPAARSSRAAPRRAGRLRGLGRAHVLCGAGRGQGVRDALDRDGRAGGPPPGLRVPAAAGAPHARVRGGRRLNRVRPGGGDLAAIAAAPSDVVLQVHVPESLAGAEALGAVRLRALGPPSANVTASVRLPPGYTSAPRTPAGD